MIAQGIFKKLLIGPKNTKNEQRDTMGQYWTMKNLDKREVLGTHAFGSGLKYLEQCFSGALYTALMVLLTDLSSLGHGGGDFCLSDMPEELKKIIDPVIGSWAGNRVVFSGDYTQVKEYEESDVDGEETFTDISDKTALAIWTMVACDTITMVRGTDEEDAETVKKSLLDFLKGEVCRYKPWESDSHLKSLLEAIEEVIPNKAHSSATKRPRSADEVDEEKVSVNKRRSARALAAVQHRPP